MIVLVPAHVLEELTEPAHALSPDLRLVPYAEDDAPIPDAANAHAVFRWVAGTRYARLIADYPGIRWLHTASAGVDHVLTPPVRARENLIVTDSGPAFAIPIGEFVIASMLAVSRRLFEMREQQRAHRWEWMTQRELWGQTVGVIGLGPIGRGVAARALGMRTLGLRRRSEPAPEVDETLTGTSGLARVLVESDFVVLAAALTGETRALIGSEELAWMKPTAWLINIARGDLVDEAALLTALQESRIGGACLDVFAQEPLPADSPFWDLPNVLISPHSSSGWTAELRARQNALFLQNLGRYLRGEPLQSVVDVSRSY